MEIGGFMNVMVILISNHLIKLKPTSQSVVPNNTLKVDLPILRPFLLLVLETLLRHRSVSTIIHFCLTAFPQKTFH
jgi:hypothetical protein